MPIISNLALQPALLCCRRLMVNPVGQLFDSHKPWGCCRLGGWRGRAGGYGWLARLLRAYQGPDSRCRQFPVGSGRICSRPSVRMRCSCFFLCISYRVQSLPLSGQAWQCSRIYWLPAARALSGVGALICSEAKWVGGSAGV